MKTSSDYDLHLGSRRGPLVVALSEKGAKRNFKTFDSSRPRDANDLIPVRGRAENSLLVCFKIRPPIPSAGCWVTEEDSIGGGAWLTGTKFDKEKSHKSSLGFGSSCERVAISLSCGKMSLSPRAFSLYTRNIRQHKPAPYVRSRVSRRSRLLSPLQ